MTEREKRTVDVALNLLSQPYGVDLDTMDLIQFALEAIDGYNIFSGYLSYFDVPTDFSENRRFFLSQDDADHLRDILLPEVD